MVKLIEIHHSPALIIDPCDLCWQKHGIDTAYSKSFGVIPWAQSSNVDETPIKFLHRVTGLSLDQVTKAVGDSSTVQDVLMKLHNANIDNASYLRIKYYMSVSMDRFPLKEILADLDVKIKYSDIQYGSRTKIYISSIDYRKAYVMLENSLVSRNILDINDILSRHVTNTDVILEAYMRYEESIFITVVMVTSHEQHPMSETKFMCPSVADQVTNALDTMTPRDITKILGYSSPKTKDDVMRLTKCRYRNTHLTQNS